MEQRFLTLLLMLFCGAACSPLDVHASFFETPFSETPFFEKENRSQFIPADQAFAFNFSQRGTALELSWKIHPGYYLYQQQINILPQHAILGSVVFPKGELYRDEFYGNVTVFSGQLDLQIPLENIKENASVSVTYQGCAEAGFCYPPATQIVPLSAVTDTHNQSTGITKQGTIKSAAIEKIPSVLPPFSPLFALLAGIVIAFTPCVLPLYPLISGIILGCKKQGSHQHTFLLALVYVQGMALSYTLLGLVIASAGLQFQALLQHPYVLVGLSVACVFLALSMFGLYSLQLPVSLQTQLAKWSHHQRGGSLGGVFVMGGLAGLMCSPCTTAPLSAILLYIAQSGDRVAGAGTLYLYALGMGIPLIIVTVCGNRWLPRSGPWMQYTKEASGFIMLALPIFLLERIPGNSWSLMLWSALGISFFGWGFILSLQGQKNWMRILQVLLLAATLLVAQPLQERLWGTSAQQTPVSPLNFQRLDNLEQINKALAQAKGKYVMLDVYASWCVTCKELEKKTFSDARVQNQLKNTVLLQADISASTPAQRAILRQFRVLGLPAILFFDPQGSEIPQARVSGFMDANYFLAHLREIMPQAAP